MMSLVTIQIGQCGNQVGHEFFTKIYDDSVTSRQPGIGEGENVAYRDEAIERFFYIADGSAEPLRARAVLVDTESKVIFNVHKAVAAASSDPQWRYGADSYFYKQRGAGNNWAQGYRVYGPAFKDQLSDMIRREVERCHRLSGFLSLASLAGGTGSGLGAYICELLRDEYPHSTILAHAVWPYMSGEIIVQNYNALLSVSHLYQSADALLVMENDWLHKICVSALGLSAVTMRDMNRVIGHQLASLLLPVQCGSDSGLADTLARVNTTPQYKLLSLRTAPIISDACLQYTTYTWHTFIKLLRQMLINNSFTERGLDWQLPAGGDGRQGAGGGRCVGNLLVLRGKDSHTVDVTPLSDPRLYVPWLSSDHHLSVRRSPRHFDQYECVATLLSNGQACVPALDSVVGKAWQMFAAGAYLHRYTHYGLEEAHFMDCFASLEQVVATYRDL